MATTLLTKNELKKQRETLKLYSRYLPTLQLKKQQIQTVLRSIGEILSAKEQFEGLKLSEISEWVAVMSECTTLEQYVTIAHVTKGKKTVAGVEVPVYTSVEFKDHPYDLFTTPLWVDNAVKVIKELIANKIEIDILKEQIDLLYKELQITTQRVNLFEKVKIPQAKNLIRKIQISIADQQTAAVVRGKISKRKMETHHKSL